MGNWLIGSLQSLFTRLFHEKQYISLINQLAFLPAMLCSALEMPLVPHVCIHEKRDVTVSEKKKEGISASACLSSRVNSSRFYLVSTATVTRREQIPLSALCSSSHDLLVSGMLKAVDAGKLTFGHSLFCRRLTMQPTVELTNFSLESSMCALQKFVLKTYAERVVKNMCVKCQQITETCVPCCECRNRLSTSPKK